MSNNYKFIKFKVETIPWHFLKIKQVPCLTKARTNHDQNYEFDNVMNESPRYSL